MTSVLGFVIEVYRVGPARRTRNPQNAQADVEEAVENFIVQAVVAHADVERLDVAVLLLLAQFGVKHIDTVLVGRFRMALLVSSASLSLTTQTCFP